MIEYGDIQLKIIEGYDLTKSSQTVSFSNLTADFTNHNSSDLPQKYQECKIYVNEKLKFIGYINGYSFKEMREKDEFLEIEFELLSPMAMTTIRTQIATGTYQLKNLIEFVLEPLIDDGFQIKEINITDRQLTVNYVCETIEYIMSDLSSNYNLWWFIDENKNIYVKDINIMLNSEPKHIYDDTHKINGLMYLKPTIMSQDYANVVNFKNVRIYQYSRQEFNGNEHNPLINEQISTMTNGKELDFNYPIDFNENNILKSAISVGKSMTVPDWIYGLYISGFYTDNTTFSLYKYYDTIEKKWYISENIGFDGNEDSNQEFLLKRDPFFSNLIVGFKYNGNKTIKSITSIESDSALIWNVNKFYNDKGINDKKNKISNSGIIELTIDMNEQWKTLPELMDIGASYINKSSLSLGGQLEIGIDKNTFNVGDIIEINKMIFNGKYIITSVKERNTKNHCEYIATCKNTNVEDNYINLFRGKTSQENSDRIYQTYITHYTQEGIKETHEVVK
jgi:hypothetical protein